VARAGRLMDGFLTTQLLYVAVKLGVADVLAAGPRTGPEVATAVGADPDLRSGCCGAWPSRRCWPRWTGAVRADQPAVIRMDLHMLVLLGARERTEAQYHRLLADTGFQVERAVPTSSPAGLRVIEATPAS
jgi:hypothetical protein